MIPKQGRGRLASLRKRTVTSVAVGVAVGALLSLVVLVLNLATRGQTLGRIGVHYWMAALVYFTSGGAGGLVFAVAFPLRRWRVGAALLGCLVVFPLYAGFVPLLLPVDEWMSVGAVAAIASALVVGAPLGWLVWGDTYRKK